MKKLNLILLLGSLMLPTASVWAGYDEGKAAFDQRDYATALKEWMPLAEQQNSAAQYYLATMYENGRGVTKSYSQAVNWYRKSAEQGVSMAQFSLGEMYDEGRGVIQDYSQALKWYRKAANQGNFMAQFNLGEMYEKGHGLQKNDSEALQLFRRAAEKSHLGAIMKLEKLAKKNEANKAKAVFEQGLKYYEGDGVTQDYSKALALSALAFEVPYEYRLPTKADNIGDWKRFNAPNHLKADFNGDGIEDEAYILPKKNSKLGYGVFVSINKTKASIQSGRKVQLFKLTADNDMQPQSFAIELAKPSNKILKTACGKGYWDCELGEPAEFKVTKPSIMFCYIESSCTMYVWDKDKLSFKEIPFSD